MSVNCLAFWQSATGNRYVQKLHLQLLDYRRFCFTEEQDSIHTCGDQRHLLFVSYGAWVELNRKMEVPKSLQYDVRIDLLELQPFGPLRTIVEADVFFMKIQTDISGRYPFRRFRCAPMPGTLARARKNTLLHNIT